MNIINVNTCSNKKGSHMRALSKNNNPALSQRRLVNKKMKQKVAPW